MNDEIQFVGGPFDGHIGENLEQTYDDKSRVRFLGG